VHLHPIPIPARERDARKDHENFFFDHQDYVSKMGAQHGFNYTALRPQLVIGPTPGALNEGPGDGASAWNRSKTISNCLDHISPVPLDPAFAAESK
jgi:hypothetical protein